MDLDGSTGDAGVFSKVLGLTAGVQYTASFDLAGSQRGSTETVDVTFGSSGASYTLASADPLAARALMFTPPTSGDFTLAFANTGGDNVRVLLDNVSVTAIPEPAAAALMLTGLGVVLLAAAGMRPTGKR